MIQHKCVKCGNIYEHAAEEIINGCICGSKMFYFVKPGSNSKKKNPLSDSEIEYFYELDDEANNEIIVFDIEAINIKSNGKYELNINSLMNKNDDGVIYKYGDGKYSIDIEENLKKLVKKKK